MELTLADYYAARDYADAAGNEKTFQHFCRKIDELENEMSDTFTGDDEQLDPGGDFLGDDEGEFLEPVPMEPEDDVDD